MTEYRDAFEALAERGSAIGPTALIERIEFEPLTAPHQRAPLHPTRGVLVAALVFLAVLVAGIVLNWSARNQSEVVDVPEVEWMRYEPQPSSRHPVLAGPGGFLADAGSEGFEFSADGENWAVIKLPKSAPGQVRDRFLAFQVHSER